MIRHLFEKDIGISNATLYSSLNIQIDPITWNKKRAKLSIEYRQKHSDKKADTFYIEPHMIVVHSTAACTYQSTFSTFDPVEYTGNNQKIKKGGKLNHSSHFVVDRNDPAPTIYQIMPEEFMGRHIVGFNDESIGIEVVGGTNDCELTLAQALTTSKLIEYLLQAYPTITHIIGHHEYEQVKNTSYFKALDREYQPWHKSDPGEQFMCELRSAMTVTLEPTNDCYNDQI